MPPKKNPAFIDWRTSEAKIVLMDDLENGVLPLDENVLSAAEAWDVYKGHEAFKDLVVFAQFEVRLKAHRKLFLKSQGKSALEMVAFEHDRKLYPRASRNARDELVFDMSSAKQLLRADMKEQKHVGLSPAEFQHTRKDVYLLFSKDKFKQRMYQEKRYQKFCRYLEGKREKKLEEAQQEKMKAREERVKLKKKKEEEKIVREANAYAKRMGNKKRSIS